MNCNKYALGLLMTKEYKIAQKAQLAAENRCVYLKALVDSNEDYIRKLQERRDELIKRQVIEIHPLSTSANAIYTRMELLHIQSILYYKK